MHTVFQGFSEESVWEIAGDLRVILGRAEPVEQMELRGDVMLLRGFFSPRLHGFDGGMETGQFSLGSLGHTKSLFYRS